MSHLPSTHRPAPGRARRRWLLGCAIALCWAGLPSVGLAMPTLTEGLLMPAPQALQLRLSLTDNSRLVLERRPWQMPDAGADPAAKRLQVSLGLEFRASDPVQGARSLLRVQLSGGSTLQFRPRGGGLALSYRQPF